jgi:hypothetical protein
MERTRLREGLFALILTEPRICGSVFPVCKEAYLNLDSEDYAGKVLSNKPVETL